MPRFESYDSRLGVKVRSPTREAPAVKIDPSALTAQDRAISQFGSTLTGVSENFIRAKSDQEYAQAKIAGYKQLAQLESDSLKDNDFQNFEPKYSKRMQQIQQNISKTIRNPIAKQQFQQDFEIKSTYSFHDIMASGRKRFVEYDKDLMSQEVVTAKKRYFTALTTGEKQDAKDELARIFSRRVENNLLTDTEADAFRQKEMVDLVEGQADQDILGDPVYALTELQKGEKGAYKGLDRKKRLDLIDSAESQIKKIQEGTKEATRVAINDKEAELIDLKATGALTEAKVKDELKILGIRPEFAKSMIDALRNPKVTPRDTAFNDIVEGILHEESTTEEVHMEIVKENALGEITDEEMAILNTFNEKITKDIIENTFPRINLMQWLSGWTDKYAGRRPEIKMQTFKDYMRLINNGTQPKDAANQALSNAVKRENPQLELSEEPVGDFYRQEAEKRIRAAGKQVNDANIALVVEALKAEELANAR